MATIYYTATTLDGFLATPDNSLDWLFEVPGADDAESGIDDHFLPRIGALAMGSTTYEWVLEHEQMMDHPEKWQEWYAERPTWVFSHRDLPLIPGADLRVTSDDVRSVHAEMVAAAGEGDVWLMGGGDLVGQFDDAGLLDRVMSRSRASWPMPPGALRSASSRPDSSAIDCSRVSSIAAKCRSSAAMSAGSALVGWSVRLKALSRKMVAPLWVGVAPAGHSGAPRGPCGKPPGPL